MKRVIFILACFLIFAQLIHAVTKCNFSDSIQSQNSATISTVSHEKDGLASDKPINQKFISDSPKVISHSKFSVKFKDDNSDTDQALDSLTSVVKQKIGKYRKPKPSAATKKTLIVKTKKKLVQKKVPPVNADSINAVIVVKKLLSDYKPFDNNISFRDTMIYDPVLLPVVFDGNILSKNLNFISDTIVHQNLAYGYRLINRDSTFIPLLRNVEERQLVRKNYYIHNPKNIRQNALTFDTIPIIAERVVKKRNILNHLLSTQQAVEIDKSPLVKPTLIKPVHWIVKAEHSLQASNTSFSKNWYLGDNSAFSVDNYHKVETIYGKNKFLYDNTVEWKLSIQAAQADKIHKINIVEDYFRLYEVIGYETPNVHWSYNTNVELKTPFFDKYDVNSTVRKAAFLSPMQLNAGVGVRYSYTYQSERNQFRNTDLKLDLSPFSVNYTYVKDRSIDPTTLGVKAGHRGQSYLGPTVNMNLTYKYNMFSAFTSRFKYFTSFTNVIMESENSFTFALNKYLSTKVYLYVRYDDTLSPDTKDKTWGYFQFNEMLGFGFTYNWSY